MIRQFVISLCWFHCLPTRPHVPSRSLARPSSQHTAGPQQTGPLSTPNTAAPSAGPGSARKEQGIQPWDLLSRPLCPLSENDTVHSHQGSSHCRNSNSIICSFIHSFIPLVSSACCVADTVPGPGRCVVTRQPSLLPPQSWRASPMKGDR